MSTESAGASASTGMLGNFVRLGGCAGLLAVVLGIVINVVLLAPPPTPPDFNAPIGDIAAYVAAQADVLAVGHGLRYIAQFLLLFFGVGLYRFTSGPDEGPQRLWAIVGLLGALWIPAVGIIANSVETVAVWQAETLAQQPQLLVALWGISGALWNSVLAPWATLILGFSVAGRLSGAVPVWLMGLGLVTAASGLVGAVGIKSVMNGGWAGVPAFTAFVLVTAWVVIMSVVMIRTSRSSTNVRFG